jgi:hypothetical protein
MYYVKKVFFLVVALFCGPLFVSAAALSVSPLTGSFPVGSTFTISIQVNTQGDSAEGVDVRYLNFNPLLLQVIDENSGIAGVQILPGSLMSNTPINIVDNATGRISFSQVPSGGKTFTNSAFQTLATVRFRVLAPGVSAVIFNHEPGNTADSNVAVGGMDLLTSISNGYYTLASGSSCHLLTTPQDYNPLPQPLLWLKDFVGKAYDAYNPSKLFASITCPASSSPTLAIQGSGPQYQILWFEGYMRKENASAWEKLTFTGTSYQGYTDWKDIGNSAQLLHTLSSLTQQDLSNTTALLFYICAWNGTAWKCGCEDTQCATPKWQLQGIRKQ